MAVDISLRLPPIFASLTIPLLYANNILALAIGPHNRALQLGITLPVIPILLAQNFYHHDYLASGTSTYGLRYGLSFSQLAVAFLYVDWILLKCPDKEGWRTVRYVRGKDGRMREELEGDPRGTGFWGSCWWGLRLSMGSRHVGWTQQVKNLPERVGMEYERWRFIVFRTARAAFMHLLADAIACYTVATPHGSFSAILHVKPTVGYMDHPFLYKVWFAWIHAFVVYIGLEYSSSMVAVVSVALGLAHPRDCPRQFGDLRGLYSVRNTWSKVWHQQLRRICTAPGIWLARDVLHLRKGSFASKYLQLYIAFAVSGIVHAGGAVLAAAAWVDDRALAFFLGQATIIMFEDHVIDWGKRMGLRDSAAWRVVGWVWTFTSFSALLVPWTSRGVENGMWEHPPTPDWFGIAPKFAV